MWYLPDVVQNDPDTFFDQQWLDDFPTTCDPTAAAIFKQLLTSSDYSEEKLENRKFFLLHDYGQLYHRLNALETEKSEIYSATHKKGTEAKRHQTKMFAQIAAKRRQIMKTWETVVCLLIAICHHLRTVRAGRANPTKCDLTDCKGC